jgi:hypothetical protein
MTRRSSCWITRASTHSLRRAVVAPRSTGKFLAEEPQRRSAPGRHRSSIRAIRRRQASLVHLSRRCPLTLRSRRRIPGPVEEQHRSLPQHSHAARGRIRAKSLLGPLLACFERSSGGRNAQLSEKRACRHSHRRAKSTRLWRLGRQACRMSSCPGCSRWGDEAKPSLKGCARLPPICCRLFAHYRTQSFGVSARARTGSWQRGLKQFSSATCGGAWMCAWWPWVRPACCTSCGWRSSHPCA